jgi:hypothetical protein
VNEVSAEDCFLNLTYKQMYPFLFKDEQITQEKDNQTQSSVFNQDHFDLVVSQEPNIESIGQNIQLEESSTNSQQQNEYV